MYAWLLFGLLGLATAVDEEKDKWTPPSNAKPAEVLEEARKDRQAKRYEVALAKHLWYHENALKIEPAQYGVRLSFALLYWSQLASEYPPARKALEDARDEAAKKVLLEENLIQNFFELAAINKELKDDNFTKDFFLKLEKENSARAKELYPWAQPVLIATKSYETCIKYVSEADYEKIARELKPLQVPNINAKAKDEFAKFQEKKFQNSSATLVALLTLAKKEDAAKRVAEKAKTKFSDQDFHKQIDEALTGIVPDPWP